MGQERGDQVGQAGQVALMGKQGRNLRRTMRSLSGSHGIPLLAVVVYSSPWSIKVSLAQCCPTRSNC